MELMKQIHLFKTGFVIFFKGATFSDFIDTRLSGIKIRFRLFWNIYFQLGSSSSACRDVDKSNVALLLCLIKTSSFKKRHY